MRYLSVAVAAAALALLFLVEPALAAKQAPPSEFRQWWSLCWRIINFLILAFLIYKVAKKPLVDFVKGRRASVETELSELEEAKQKAQAEYEALQKKTAGMAQELAAYQDSLAAMVDKQRLCLLDDARREAEMIVGRAELWAEQALRDAKAQLADEILELAGQIAMEKIQASITEDDRAKMVDEFTSTVQSQGAGVA